jgi:hypothetical protein
VHIWQRSPGKVAVLMCPKAKSEKWHQLIISLFEEVIYQRGSF